MDAEELLLTHAERFRHSVPIRLGAYWAFLGGAVLCTALQLYPMPIIAMGVVTLTEAVVLGLSYRAAAGSRLMAGAYLAFEGICQTILFWFCGDLRLGVAPIVYTFELINPGLYLGRLAHFVVANGLGALYSLLILLEQTGVLALIWSEVPVWRPDLGGASVVLVFASMNVAAIFVSETRRLLEGRTLDLVFAKQALQEHSAELEHRVQERTAALERSYRDVQRQSDELQAFVYAVTHDLKNPLSAILLTADLALKRNGGALPTECREDLGQIMRMAGHTEDMIRDLLGLFSITSTQEPADRVELERLVSDALTTLRPLIQAKNVRVDVGPLPACRGQPTKLAHLIGNLLANAVKYVSPIGGHVDVTATVEGDFLELSVSDNGPGIPEEYHERIFDLFTRVPETERSTGNDEPGTGVGLATVRQVVAMHGGSVWVESSPGAGACFRVRLPAIDSREIVER